ncbi:hypothetical protein ACT8ZV_03695 [Nocardioides sp. MAHUQ-72]|uniref:hypothetical protein n=1 Tax=unclassified Nocardioides TaxID=2615069 RepID=UPI0036218210
MTSSADYCDHCDLPLSQCVHGQPPPPPPEKKAAPVRRAKPATSRAKAAPAVSVTSKPPRRTPQREFRRFILAALQDNGGRAEMEDVMAELERRMEPVLRPADHETVNQGEIRWRYAARLERKAMLDEGLIQPPRQPGVWELTDLGRSATE